jgi:hypothetical protein
VTASLRYEDGKTLKGIGTRASKSRLTGVAAFLLEALSNRYKNNPKGRQERTSWLLEIEGLGVRKREKRGV